MTRAVVWTKDLCTYCDQAKALLDTRGIEYEERRIGDAYSREDLLAAVPGARSVPQVFLDGRLIGGYTELRQHLEKA